MDDEQLHREVEDADLRHRTVIGLRAMADAIEQHPELPVNKYGFEANVNASKEQFVALAECGLPFKRLEFTDSIELRLPSEEPAVVLEVRAPKEPPSMAASVTATLQKFPTAE